VAFAVAAAASTAGDDKTKDLSTASSIGLGYAGLYGHGLYGGALGGLGYGAGLGYAKAFGAYGAYPYGYGIGYGYSHAYKAFPGLGYYGGYGAFLG